jgi:hypothetical protein
MATVTGAPGEWFWEPNPALKAALQRLAAQQGQRVIQPWLNAQQRQWSDVARQTAGYRETMRRASEVGKAISASAGQAQFEVWRQHQEQIAQTIRLMQARPSLRMGFSTPTFDRATGLLEQLRSAPPEVPADMEAAALEIPDAVVQEAVKAAEAAVSDVDPALARNLVVALITTFVFLKVLQWAIEHPEAAAELLTAGTLAWFFASAAGNQAGRLWDKIFAARSPDPDADPDSDD